MYSITGTKRINPYFYYEEPESKKFKFDETLENEYHTDINLYQYSVCETGMYKNKNICVRTKNTK